MTRPTLSGGGGGGGGGYRGPRTESMGATLCATGCMIECRLLQTETQNED